MVAAAVWMAVVLPSLRWAAILSLVGGIAVALTLIGARNRRARRAVAVGGVVLVLAVAAGTWFYLRW